MLDGVEDDVTWDSLWTVLPTLVDGKGDYSMSWSGSRPRAVSLAPVAQPEALALRINFGKVERIEGRTICVRVDPKQARLQAFLLKARELIEDFPNCLRRLAFMWRVKIVAWWTGESEDEVFWTLIREMFSQN
jgi:hypothetical protein